MVDTLVEKFLSNPKNLRMGSGKLAKRWKVSYNDIKEARERAHRLLKQDNRASTSNYIADLEDEVVKKVDLEKGTLQSTTVSNFEPKTHEELALLHRIDLTLYKISSYWSKLKSTGKFTSSVFCTLRKVEEDQTLQVDLLKEILEKELKLDIRRTPRPARAFKKGNSRALIVVTADEHVAAANLQDDLYNIPYDKTEYILRKMNILEAIEKFTDGEVFDDFFDIKLGDDLDGWNCGTTRSGEPGHAHVLPQNMSNKTAVETYIRVNNYYWDELVKVNPAKNYHKYDIVNSNHGGNGLDYLANLGVQIYLEAKHPEVRINYIHKLLGHFQYGNHNFILTHGKDENYRKKPLPLNLDPVTEVFIKQYMDIHKLSADQHNVVLKGDLHQWNWNSGKFFDYINVGSLYGSSGWVQANFGLTKPSFAIGIIDSETNDFTLKPVYLNTPLA